MRKRAEGVRNIIRFNWHLYAGAAGIGLLLTLGMLLLHGRPNWQLALGIALLAVVVPTAASLGVSWYVYDVSELYTFRWLMQADSLPERMVNIHAGFDETSALLQQQFPAAALRVLDFYNPAEHTEVSIRRARAAAAPYPGTEAVCAHALPLATASVDLILLLLAAHEIRQPEQRVAFLREVSRALAPGGRVVLVEHLRDPVNFLAYTIGFLHFYSRRTWLAAFQSAGLRVAQEQKLTPFISAFTLHASDGSTP